MCSPERVRPPPPPPRPLHGLAKSPPPPPATHSDLAVTEQQQQRSASARLACPSLGLPLRACWSAGSWYGTGTCKGISIRTLHINKQPWLGRLFIKSFKNLLRFIDDRQGFMLGNDGILLHVVGSAKVLNHEEMGHVDC
ncbi:hypothetical protein ACQJBY_015201 [Aegilops geniculata]